MAKFHDPFCVGAHADNDIRDLIRRRADAKQELDLEVQCMDLLLETSPYANDEDPSQQAVLIQ